MTRTDSTYTPALTYTFTPEFGSGDVEVTFDTDDLADACRRYNRTAEVSVQVVEWHDQMPKASHYATTGTFDALAWGALMHYASPLYENLFNHKTDFAEALVEAVAERQGDAPDPHTLTMSKSVWGSMTARDAARSLNGSMRRLARQAAQRR